MFKTSLAVVLFVAVFSTVKTSSFADGFEPYANNSCNKPGEVRCSEDCRSLRVCTGEGEGVLINCQTQTGHPWCDEKTNMCTDHIDTCSGDSKKFCLRPNGKFPNVDNCKEFVECVNNHPYHYECPPNTVYNQRAGYCQTGIQCYNYSPISGLCKGKQNVAIEYALDHKFYVVCTPLQAYLFMCEGDEGDHWEFNPSLGVCDFACSAVGLFPDPRDQHSYYECVKVGATWERTHRKCPEGLNFNPHTSSCEK